MRIVRIVDSERGRRTPEFVPYFRVGSVFRSDWEASSIATIELPSRDQLCACPNLYGPHACADPCPQVSVLRRSKDDPVQAFITKNRVFLRRR